MHWVNEALIWAGLSCGIFLGYTLFTGAFSRKEKDLTDLIFLFVGLFLLVFSGIYMFFRFIIVLSAAMPNHI